MKKQDWKLVYFPSRDWEILDRLAKLSNDKKTNIIHNALLLTESKLNQDSQNYKLMKDFLIDNQKALESLRVTIERQTSSLDLLIKTMSAYIKQKGKR